MPVSLSSSRLRTLIPTAAAAVALVGSMTACSSSEDSSAAAADGSLKVTTLGLCNEIPVYWAESNGLFKKNGVDVELVKSTGGAAALTALQSGDIDLAFTNPFSTQIAVSQGLDLQWIATAYETTSVEGEGTNAVVVKTGSGITDAKGLEGKTVAVNEVGGINEIITNQWMRVSGADPKKVKFVALPFAELASSVVSDKVNASQMPRQNISADLADKLTAIVDPFVAAGEGKGLIFAGYVTTGDKAKNSEKSMKGFQAALIEANAEFNKPENSDAKYALEAEHCKQDPKVLATLPENIYEARVDTDALSRMGQMLLDQERLTKTVDPADLVPDYIETK